MHLQRPLLRLGAATAIVIFALLLIEILAGGSRLSPAASAQLYEGPESFRCSSDGGELSWSDAGRSKYWVYKSTDNRVSYQWLGRTLGATEFTDASRSVGAKYQVHYAGIPRIECTIETEPASGGAAFACRVDADVLSWSDHGQSKYWIYRSTDGTNFAWLGRTLGATTFTDPAAVAGATYQVHYAGIPRVACTTDVVAPPPAPAPLTELPGIIEAEDNFRAVDTTPGNQGLATEFTGDVDVWPLPDNDGHIVGLTEDGESSSYRVSFDGAGIYHFAIVNASGGQGSDVTVRVNGRKVGTTTRLAPTSGWWEFTPTDIGSIAVANGPHIVTVQWGAGQSNFDSLIVTRGDEIAPSCVIKGVVVESALPPANCNLLSNLFADPNVSDPCTWPVVTCDSYGKVITILNVADEALTELPPEIGDLSNLRRLYLSNNGLRSLPPELGELRFLNILSVRQQPDLTALPAEIGNLRNLETLALDDNGLTSLPAEITNLTNLSSLLLSGNALTSLPTQFGNLAGLRTLDLSENDLATLPAGISALANLNWLNLADNDVTSLPPDSANLAALDFLSLNNNGLTSLPAEVTALGGLVNLDVANNNLSSVPPEIDDLTNLKTLRVNDNALTSLPPEIVNLPNLRNIWLADNLLRGDIGLLAPSVNDRNLAVYIADGEGGNDCLMTTDADLRAELDRSSPGWDRCDDGDSPTCVANGAPVVSALSQADCDVLSVLVDRGDALGDPCNWAGVTCDDAGSSVIEFALVDRRESLPPEIGALSDLTSLTVSFNDLTSVPPEIGNLTNLVELTLRRNPLTALPPEIGNLTNLVTLNLYDNQLTTLPSEIGNLTNLTTLDVSRNALTSLPAEIGNLTNLTEIDLSYNPQLTSLPTEVANLTRLAKLDLGYGDLTALPIEVTTIPNLTELLLIANDITSLPPEIGDLTNLEVLDLGTYEDPYDVDPDGNELTTLPPEIGNLTNLEVLRLDHNDLTSLPPEIANLTNLRVVDLRRNELRGDITVLAAGLADDELSVFVADGTGFNDCLGTTDAALQQLLDATDAGWDRCDVP